MGDQFANIRKVENMIENINDSSVRLVAFCKYGLSGFSTNMQKISEPIPGKITDALSEVVRKHNVWITGGLRLKGADVIINSTFRYADKSGTPLG